ncbi:MAG TPA: hypothetical protein VN476_12615 [Pyrinomonadaceae bacterium]|nr:hypothetical protein [Pyrinomonadaceae bacterium]
MRSVRGFSRRMAFMFGLLLLATTILANRADAEDHFSVKEYNEFHDVLRPLQHEALPNKDFQRIRTNAAELVKRGKAIIQAGLPSGTPSKDQEEFRKELKKFEGALGDFSKHAQDGTDAQLEASFSAVHDSFEMLVGMLPRK